MHAKIYGYEYKWFLGTRKSHLKSEKGKMTWIKSHSVYMVYIRHVLCDLNILVPRIFLRKYKHPSSQSSVH